MRSGLFFFGDEDLSAIAFLDFCFFGDSEHSFSVSDDTLVTEEGRVPSASSTFPTLSTTLLTRFERRGLSEPLAPAAVENSEASKRTTEALKGLGRETRGVSEALLLSPIIKRRQYRENILT